MRVRNLATPDQTVLVIFYAQSPRYLYLVGTSPLACSILMCHGVTEVSRLVQCLYLEECRTETESVLPAESSPSYPEVGGGRLRDFIDYFVLESR